MREALRGDGHGREAFNALDRVEADLPALFPEVKDIRLRVLESLSEVLQLLSVDSHGSTIPRRHS